jgi:hypothetical protein
MALTIGVSRVIFGDKGRKAKLMLQNHFIRLPGEPMEIAVTVKDARHPFVAPLECNWRILAALILF